MGREGSHPGPRPGDFDPADPRESEVIAFAKTFASGENRYVPRWLAAGMLFFRLDPGFRGEVAAARIEWVGSPEAPYAGSTPPSWDNDDALGSLALGFAARWGILVEDAADLLATDKVVTVADFVWTPDHVDDLTGQRFARLDIRSRSVLDEIERTLGAIRGARGGRRWRPKAERRRQSGRFARVVAIHFLTQRSGAGRESGGRRSRDTARLLWQQETGDRVDDSSGWRKERDRFLAEISAHRMDPIERLIAIRSARHLDERQWIDLLTSAAPDRGATAVSDEWRRVTSTRERPQPWFWTVVRQAFPELLEDLAIDAKVTPRGCQG